MFGSISFFRSAAYSDEIRVGNGTEPWLIAAAHAVADLLPTASLQAVPGEQHSAAADVLAPALRQFAHGNQTPRSASSN